LLLTFFSFVGTLHRGGVGTICPARATERGRYKVYAKNNDANTRPMMLDLMWVEGLTIRDLNIRRPGYWTVHPTFSNNVRIENNSIITTASTPGCRLQSVGCGL
jgi:polygalacturonase